MQKELKHVLEFGSNGDKAMVEALSHNFLVLFNFTIFCTSKRMLSKSRRSLEFLPKLCKKFGKTCCKNIPKGSGWKLPIQEFNERVENLKPLWDAREKTFAPASGPGFHSYFIKCQADVVCYHMRRDFCASAGLGSSPTKFTTNVPESLNAAIKRKVNLKEPDWPEFISDDFFYLGFYILFHVRSLYLVMTNIDCAQMLLIMGCQLSLGSKWHLNSDMRLYLPLKKPDFQRRAIPRTEENVECSIAYDTLAPEAEVSLSISAEDSRIISISLVTLTAMWNKASELLSTQNAITPVPGNDSKAKMDLSRSQDVPHHVHCHSDG